MMERIKERGKRLDFWVETKVNPLICYTIYFDRQEFCLRGGFEG
jgi:hypothetical protein